MALAQKEDEQDFRQMWTEAQNRFEKTTKMSLVQKNNRSLDDVLRELDKRFNTDDAQEGGAQRRVKELASNVLTFIKLLGGIAAQGASIVFGPANLCFNAMQFLIDIPAKVSKFHEGLALLFEKISTFMKQFKVYQRIEQYAKVDVELKQSTHKLLIAFVDVCGLSIDAVSGSKLKKMWTVAKIALFEDDSGVQEKLKEFQMLIDHQSQISDAVTLEHVVKTEHMLSEMSKALDDSTQLLAENSLKTDIVVKYVNNSAGQKNSKTRSNEFARSSRVARFRSWIQFKGWRETPNKWDTRCCRALVHGSKILFRITAGLTLTQRLVHCSVSVGGMALESRVSLSMSSTALKIGILCQFLSIAQRIQTR